MREKKEIRGGRNERGQRERGEEGEKKERRKDGKKEGKRNTQRKTLESRKSVLTQKLSNKNCPGPSCYSGNYD